MGRQRRIALVAALTLAAAAAGCGGDDGDDAGDAGGSTTTAVAPGGSATTEGAAQPLPTPDLGTVEAGTYVTTGFEPPLTFRVDEPVRYTDVIGAFTLVPDGDPVDQPRRVGIYTLDQASVFADFPSPEQLRGGLGPVPDDYLASLRGRAPGLDLADVGTPLTVAGMDGQLFDYTVGDLPDRLPPCEGSGTPCVAILQTLDPQLQVVLVEGAAGAMGVVSGGPGRFLVTVEAPQDALAQFRDGQARDILATLSF